MCSHECFVASRFVETSSFTNNISWQILFSKPMLGSLNRWFSLMMIQLQLYFCGWIVDDVSIQQLMLLHLFSSRLTIWYRPLMKSNLKQHPPYIHASQHAFDKIKQNLEEQLTKMTTLFIQDNFEWCFLNLLSFT